MIQEVKPGWLQNQIEHTAIEMKANILVKEIISFSKRKEDVPTREEMYLILKKEVRRNTKCSMQMGRLLRLKYK